MGSYGCWKVMEIDNAIFHDLERFGKREFLKVAMQKLRHQLEIAASILV